MLSEEKESATSGALPPRTAATIFSSFTPATVFTWTLGWTFSKSATTLSKTPDSRSPGVNGCQTVIVTSLFGSNA